MIRKAIRIALKSKRKQRHCTILFKGGAVVAVGQNTEKHHSEVKALKKVFFRGVTSAFNLRLKPSGETGNAKPCEKCRLELLLSGVRRVSYTTNSGSVEVMLL